MPDQYHFILAMALIVQICLYFSAMQVLKDERRTIKRQAGEYVALLSEYDAVMVSRNDDRHLIARLGQTEMDARAALNRVTAELADLRRRAYVREGTAFKRVTPIATVAAK